MVVVDYKPVACVSRPPSSYSVLLAPASMPTRQQFEFCIPRVGTAPTPHVADSPPRRTHILLFCYKSTSRTVRITERGWWLVHRVLAIYTLQCINIFICRKSVMVGGGTEGYLLRRNLLAHHYPSMPFLSLITRLSEGRGAVGFLPQRVLMVRSGNARECGCVGGHAAPRALDLRAFANTYLSS